MEAVLPFITIVISIAVLIVLLSLARRLNEGSGSGAERALREEFRGLREEQGEAARALREEVGRAQTTANEGLMGAVEKLGAAQGERLDTVASSLREMTEANERRIEKVRETVEERLRHLQESNEKRIEEMRKTVDEKLHETLEKRLGESFKQVSERLEAVQRGLGEMQELATGVGDLKRVLTNVKTRGTWGEVQLGTILEEILTPEQYERNVKVAGEGNDLVEYAIRLPGPDLDPNRCVWLPIDAKFPMEDYQRLVEASEAGDTDGVQQAGRALGRAVQMSAKTIREKYVDPPHTTDFAIMFMPTEGLYAEVLRQPGRVEELQRLHRVVVAGPTTLAAILTSLRMGFRTLAIEKRSSEVWDVLAAVKTEFGKFGDVLDKVKRQLGTAVKTIDETGVRTRVMARKLRSVEELPADRAQALLGIADGEEMSPDDGEEET
ncbi:MAG: DNA recombination protein RmuC [Candidatus Krumholzibacteriota bacterium]|nr:DNA recombination protein RmuC [Candidatus Krumholzibacteriota bacterium]